MDYFDASIDDEITVVNTLIRERKMSVVDGGILGEFENSCALLFGTRYAVGTCNGTSAIHLAFFSIGLGPGDEVIVPTYGYHAMVVPLCQLGGIPVFCDIDRDTLTIDTNHITQHITKRTKAILVHQPWGNVSNVDRLLKIRETHRLLLISDSSHAHGALWDGRPLGAFYDLVCASFGKNKLISGGELGVVTTNNSELRDRMLVYGHVNRIPERLIGNEYKYLDNAIGIKYRPHPFAMAVALQQMKTFEHRINQIYSNVCHFIKELSDLQNVTFIQSFSKATRVYWKVIVIVKEAEALGPFLNSLVEFGLLVEGNQYDPLLHENSIFVKYYGFHTQGNFATASELKKKIFQIPSFIFFDSKNCIKAIEAFKSTQARLQNLKYSKVSHLSL